jgi:hypothetical protein
LRFDQVRAISLGALLGNLSMEKSMGKGNRHLSYPSEGAKLRSLAQNKFLELLLTKVVEETMEVNGATRIDLLMALRNCAVIRSERRGNQWRRVVRGQDLDERCITMVVTVAYPQRRILVLTMEIGEVDE